MKKFTLIIITLFVTNTLLAGVPKKIHWEGVIQKNNEDIPTHQTTSLEFQIWDEEGIGTGTQLWTSATINMKPKKNSVFSVILGNPPQPEITLAFDKAYYLQIIVDNVPMESRIELGTTPYSFRSNKSDSSKHAGKSDSSRHAGKSDSSRHAGKSDSSRHAGKSDSSRHAGKSDSSRHAGKSDSSRHAGKSDSSRHAGKSDSSRHAGKADSSRHAVYSDTAKTLFRNNATTGQVMKWNGTAWVAANDETVGGGNFVTSVSAALPLSVTGTSTAPNVSLSGVVPLDKGGTGSSTKNFVDLNSTQTIGGAKTFTNSLGIGIDPVEKLQVAGKIYSTTGGFKFPDGTVQTSAGAVGDFLPLSGGIMTGPITSDPAIANINITMGKGNFGSSNANTGINAFVAGTFNRARGKNSVAMGGADTESDSNSALGDLSNINGGTGNIAYGFANVIGGGRANLAGAIGSNPMNVYNSYSTVSGGGNNIANGMFSTVPGGNQNIAQGSYSFAAGRNAQALHNGSFVWSDSQEIGSVASTGENQFVVRASGGIWFGKDNDVDTPIPSRFIQTSTGAYLSSAGVWNSVSDRNKKENFTSVNGKSILEKVASLPITIWNYKSEGSTIKHIGPTAQDFYQAFGLGNDDKTISTIDPAGIALAAIQELKKENESLRTELQQLSLQVQLLIAKEKSGSSDESHSELRDNK
ncbi:MAG: tail fiber domain-containing protein [Ignavibacteriales bacterium]|nr:tail fiber domain-containing protein [Ignavibacteriales bacterium]